MLTDPVFYAYAIPAVILLGLAKGGFVSVGAMALPLLALHMSPVQAAAIMLPVLVVQDAVSVWVFRRHWDRAVLWLMLPSAAIGILLAYVFASRVSPVVVLATLGVISIVFAIYRLWLARGGVVPVTTDAPLSLGVLLGIASGFTSQVAHAGQPPFQMWVLPKGLSPQVLVGTTAIFFAVVNLMKLPAYLALGQFSAENLLASAVLTPLAIVATLAGVWVVRRLDVERFNTIMYVLMILLGVQLLVKAMI